MSGMGGGGGMGPQQYVQMAKHSAVTTYLAANALNNVRKGRKFQKKADASKPPLVDQQEASFLNDIQTRRKNIDTGVGYATQEREADQLTANTQANILKAGGGDVGSTINGLLLAARMGSNAYNEGALTQASQQQNMLTQIAGGLVQKIADRKMQLQLADRAQYLAQAMQYKQQAQQQGTQLLMHMLDTESAGLGGFMGGKPATTQSVNGVAPPSNSGGNTQSGGKVAGLLNASKSGQGAMDESQWASAAGSFGM